LGANETKHISVTFAPDAPIHYSREVTILIQHHPPLTLKIHANAIGLLRDHHIERVAPTPILPRHIEAYKVKEARGLAKYPPSALRVMCSNETITVDEAGHLEWITEPINVAQELRYKSASPAGKPEAVKSACKKTATGKKKKRGGAEDEDEEVAEEEEKVVEGPQDPQAFMSMSTGFVEFGSCPAGSKRKVATIPTQTVSFTNPTEGELLLSWMSTHEPFTVEPMEAAVAPGASTTFTISFAPAHVNTFFTRELECFVSYTEDRHPRPTEDAFFTRPWHLIVNASGHTFPPFDPSPPKLLWDTERILFPAARAGESACVTVVVENIGETTTKIDFGATSGAGVQGGLWTCTPRAVLIAPHERQLLSFELTVDSEGRFETDAACILNGIDDQTQHITLVGSAFVPRITVGNDGAVYFPPTQVGTSVEILQSIQNSSLVPLSYEWRIPSNYANNFAVSPVSGMLGPNQRAVHQWIFSPTAEQMYPCQVPIVILDDVAAAGTKPDGPDVTQDCAVMVAEGTVGVLTSTPSELIISDSLAGVPVHKTVKLFNPGTTSVRYNLLHDGGEWTRLDHVEGMLAPGAEKHLRISVSSPGPQSAGDFTCTIYYKFETSADCPSDMQSLCIVRAGFIRPHLAVTDARAKGLSKGRLWNMLGLTEINETLADTMGDVEDGEEPIFEFNFDSEVVGEEDSMIDLEFSNMGVSDANWAMVFPDQLVYAPERWAAKTTLSPRESQEKEIIANKIFQVSPRKGVLAPGERVVVQMKYKHVHVDEDRLTVFLRVEGRPEVWLDLKGKTLPMGDGQLMLQGKHTELEPVPVGLPLASIQYYTMFNDGDEPLSFKLDKSALKQLQDDNYGFPVLECEVQRGNIPAKGSYTLPVKFWPIEPKDHTAVIQIVCDDKDPVPLAIHARGYDARDVYSVPPRFVDGRNAIPDSQHVAIKAQQATLSHERLYYGDVSMFSVTRKTVFLRNDSTKGHPLSYKFRVAAQYENVVEISPPSGHLAGGDSEAVRITLAARNGPAVYDFDVLCDIVNEQTVANHQHAVQEANTDRADAVTHFTLTDEGRTGRGRAGGHGEVTTEQGMRSVRGANVNLSAFPDALLSTGFQPSYSTNVSLSLAPGAPNPGSVQTTTKTNRAQTLRQQVLMQTGRVAGGPFDQSQTLSGDMHVFEEKFAADSSASHGTTVSGQTRAGIERPSSATRLQAIAGERSIPVSDTDLRTTRYQALPPIRVEHQKRVSTPPPLSPPTVLFIGITAHVHHVEETMPEEEGEEDNVFDGSSGDGASKRRPDFVDRRMFAPEVVEEGAPPTPWSESNGESDAVVDILSAVMQSVVEDDDFSESIVRLCEGEAPVYYRQIAGTLDGPEQTTDSVSSLPDMNKVDLRADPVFLSLAEECMESIFASLISGANSGADDLTARSRLILD
jgi:hypothetical protein